MFSPIFKTLQIKRNKLEIRRGSLRVKSHASQLVLSNAAWTMAENTIWARGQRQQDLVIATRQLQPMAWRWRTAADEAVCSICLPLHNRTAPRREDFPEIPTHPRCRYLLLPLG